MACSGSCLGGCILIWGIVELKGTDFRTSLCYTSAFILTWSLTDTDWLCSPRLLSTILMKTAVYTLYECAGLEVTLCLHESLLSRSTDPRLFSTILKKVAVYTLYECTVLELLCRLHDSLLSSAFILTWSLSVTNLKTFYGIFSLATWKSRLC